MKPKHTFFTILLMLGLTISATAKMDYKEYCNARFGFCVLHPVTFGIKPAPVNNDGREFYDGNGFYMTASAMYNVLR